MPGLGISAHTADVGQFGASPVVVRPLSGGAVPPIR